VKFLVDRCAGTRLAEYLRSLGHDVLESRTLGPDPGDSVLLQWAAAQGRVLVTVDTDFGKLVFLDKGSHCGMVRLPDVPAAERISLMETVLARHAGDLQAGAIITVRGNRIRISRHP
jgi:predicted nuclease of predicted toxin-antitoxin system